jgi:hypothetical protein
MSEVGQYMVKFERHRDQRGSLIVGECGLEGAPWYQGVPFVVKRVFWIVEPRGQRGNHAHKNCEQVIIPVAGSCRCVAGSVPRRLWEPNWGLYVPSGVNVLLEDFSDDCVVLVLCSEHYDREDYVPATREGCCGMGDTCTCTAKDVDVEVVSCEC